MAADKEAGSALSTAARRVPSRRRYADGVCVIVTEVLIVYFIINVPDVLIRALSHSADSAGGGARMDETDTSEGA